MKTQLKIFTLTLMVISAIGASAHASGDPGVEKIDADTYFIHDPNDVTGDQALKYPIVNDDFLKEDRDQVKARTLAKATLECYRKFGSTDNCVIRQKSFVMMRDTPSGVSPGSWYFSATVVIQRRNAAKAPATNQEQDSGGYTSN